MPTHFEGPEQTRLALNVFIKYTRAVNSLEHALFTSEDMDGLTSTQFGLLETLYHLGPMCPGELSVKLLKSTGNLTLVLDNLEKRGLIERTRQKDDRRMIKVHLTPEGIETIQKVFPKIAESLRQMFSALTPAELEELGRLSKKLGLSIAEQNQKPVEGIII